MSKDAKDFYSELEKASQQELRTQGADAAVSNHEYVERMSKTPFPVGKVILLVAGIIFALISNFSKIASMPIYIEHVRPLPLVNKFYQLTEINDKEMNNEILIKHGIENNIEMVQIRGRYYPKSADNTYVIDGETVFYKDQNARNRKK